jgi:hypothetical protein
MISNLINRGRKTDETGVISIITVILLSMVLTLITTAFVKSASSNQRQALDTQLSTQAFYAAESGINDVTSILNNGSSPQITGALNTNECNSFLNVIKSGTYTSLLGSDPNVLESNSPIQYTCVLVSDSVANLLLDKGNSAIFKIQADDNSVIDQLSISWGADRTVPTGSAAELYDQSNWRKENGQDKDRVALIRLTLYYPSSLDRANLISDQKTFFLRPVRAQGNQTASVVINNDAAIIGVDCHGANGPCSINLTDVASLTSSNTDNLYIRVVAIYNTFDESNMTITAIGSDGLPKNLINAQYSIDVTGRANDVYRRIEVRRPVTTNWNFPNAVVQSAGDLCKQFVVWPGGVTDEAPKYQPSDTYGCSIQP